jgi:hypothetical protein
MTEPPNLQLIHSQQNRPIKLGNIEIICGAEISKVPFPVGVQVIEEDTWQILSADNQASVSDEHPIRLMTGLIDQQPLPAGNLVIKGNHWQAVIMDVDQSPACRRDWIVAIYRQIFEQVLNDNISEISLPLLGVRHECVEMSDSLAMLVDSIKLLQGGSLLRIWLKLPEKDINTAVRLLDGVTDNK